MTWTSFRYQIYELSRWCSSILKHYWRCGPTCGFCLYMFFQPCVMGDFDDKQVEDRLPHPFFRHYSSPFQHNIDLAYARSCYHLSKFCIGYHAHVVISCCSLHIMKIPSVAWLHLVWLHLALIIFHVTVGGRISSLA